MRKSGTAHLSCVVLAAGLGTRMKSRLPKVLHQLFGRPMLTHALDAVFALKPERTVVVINEQLSNHEALSPLGASVSFAIQDKQLGTAHALLCAGEFPKTHTIMVTNGDTPLITPKTLKTFLSRHRRAGNAVSMLSFMADDPAAYGRIVRDTKGRPVRVVEKKDATAEELLIREVNSGIYALEAPALSIVKSIALNKKKGEYYLTDLIELALGSKMKCGIYCLGDEREFQGINDRLDLAAAYRAMRLSTAERHMLGGVTIIDPPSTFISPDARIAEDTVIYPGVFIEGTTRIGRGCTIYPGVRILDSTIGQDSVIKDFSIIESSRLGNRVAAGPFARIRPASVLQDDCHVGNFVETKNTVLGKGSKANHLTYLGDADIGSGCNIGAGTITCNYDGRHKYRTTLGNGVFIGSDTQLVAPVSVGNDAYVGAGSTITRDVEAGALATSRTPQKSIPGWTARKRATQK